MGMWAMISPAVRIGNDRVRQLKVGRGGFEFFDLGEVSEWLNEHDWKSCRCRKVPPGFESLPLRLNEPLKIVEFLEILFWHS